MPHQQTDDATSIMKRELDEADEEQVAKRAATEEPAATEDGSAAAEAAPAPPAEEPTAPPPEAYSAPPPEAYTAPPPEAYSAPPPEAYAAPPPMPAAAMLTGPDALVSIITANPSLVDGPAHMMTATYETTDVAFKLDLHIDAIVACFGYDGSTINTIRERTGCRVRLLEAGSDPLHRVFELMGSQDVRAAATPNCPRPSP